MARLTTLVFVLLTFVVVQTSPATARATYPPHHNLWLCIHTAEGAPTWHSTRGNLRGGLNLHYGWGYGTSYDASKNTQSVQEWGAELAYKANHYSHAWLVANWLGHDNGAGCLIYD